MVLLLLSAFGDKFFDLRTEASGFEVVSDRFPAHRARPDPISGLLDAGVLGVARQEPGESAGSDACGNV